jgi:hypothetical protein
MDKKVHYITEILAHLERKIVFLSLCLLLKYELWLFCANAIVAPRLC